VTLFARFIEVVSVASRLATAIQYLWTRGQSAALPLSKFLLGDLAPDSGFYLPETYTQVSGA
jgi:hypothetical protein